MYRMTLLLVPLGRARALACSLSPDLFVMRSRSASLTELQLGDRESPTLGPAQMTYRTGFFFIPAPILPF